MKRGCLKVVLIGFAALKAGPAVWPPANAATIAWNTPVTIAGPADVSTNGTAVLAYDWNNSAQTVNGVSFTAPAAGVSLSSAFTSNNYG